MTLTAGDDPGAVEIMEVELPPTRLAGVLCLFTCPKRGGLCAVPILPLRNARGYGWEWDGNRNAPTLTPAIDCLAVWKGILTGRCGWKGYIRTGRLVSA